MIPWLVDDPFPPVEWALTDPNGLLAAGGDLSPARLLDAYARGIFPWFGDGDPLLWWSPDPRMVLFVGELHVSRSLRRVIRSRRYSVTLDRAFVDVMAGCAEPRDGAGRHLDHRRDGRGVPRAGRARLRALGRGVGRTASWWAGCTAWRSAACSTASRCSAGGPTRRRWRSCTWSGSSSAGASS